MRLFGDVRQVEVGAEGTHQADRGLEIELADQSIELRRRENAVLGIVGSNTLGQHSHLLDQLEQRFVVLAYQRLAQQAAEQPNVAAELAVVVHGGEICALLRWFRSRSHPGSGPTRLHYPSCR